MSDQQRQRRISQAAEHHVDQPVPTAPIASAFHRVLGVVREVPTTPEDTFELRWQAIGYKDSPPKKDAFESKGDVRVGYPMEGIERDFYKGLVVSGEFKVGSPLIVAYRRNGVWLLEPLSLMLPSKCVVYEAPSNTNKFILVVRLRYDDQGRLVPAGLNPDSSPVLTQVRCWDNTDSAYWSFFRATSPLGTAAPFAVTPTTPVLPLLTIDGAETILPVFDDALEGVAGSGTRGACS